MEELNKVEAELKKEAREDAEMRERQGAAWNRPSSAALNSTLMEKIAGGYLQHPRGSFTDFLIFLGSAMDVCMCVCVSSI